MATPLSAKIQRMKDVSGATLTEMAAAAGCSDGQISHLCLGVRSDPALSQLLGLAELFEVSLDWLTRDVGQAPSDEHLRSVAARRNLGTRKRGARRASSADEAPAPDGPIVVREGYDQSGAPRGAA